MGDFKVPGAIKDRDRKPGLLETNQITEKIIAGAIRIHKTLGPGLLESVYEECLCYELLTMGLKIKRQLGIPIVYKDVKLDCGYKIDILVEDRVVVEIKAVEALAPVHEAQVSTYMKVANKSIGLLINFNVTLLKNGIRRYVF